MDEKWNAIIDGFANCPVLELTNPHAGAYAYFAYKAPYLGIQDSFISSFFLDVLGVQATTYNWGWRGADPADYFGAGYGTEDFTRLQLYRDLNVYIEIGRRAKIVCADTSVAIADDYVSIDTWAGMRRRGTRHLEENLTLETRRALLQEENPELTERQAHRLAMNIEGRFKIDTVAASCAPEYTTGCFFEKIGTRFKDQL